MRVMLWLPEFPPDPGGIATFGGELAPAMAARGHELLIVSHHDEDVPLERIAPGVELVRFSTRMAFGTDDKAVILRARREIAELKQYFRPDLYHVHPTEPSPVLHFATASVHPAPLVVTLHNELGTHLEMGGATLMGRLLDEAAVVTAVSGPSRDDLLSFRPDLAMKVLAVLNGIDPGPEPFAPTPDPVVVAGGRLVDQKGLEILTAALPAVRERVPSLRVVIVGDGDIRVDLERDVSMRGLGDVVEFVGRVSRAEVADRFAAARVVCIPSLFEGLPYFALEAAAAGRAIVGSDIGGLRPVVVDGNTGRLVPAGDPAALAAALADELTRPGLAEEHGRAAREHLVRHNSVDQMADLYDEIYRRVVARHGPARPPGGSPRVSVIVPAFQAERFVGEAVRSALDQDIGEIEVIVVDDGSADATSETARVDDPRVTVVRQPNGGTSTARNAACALAIGDLVACLDADDVWPPGRLRRLVEVLDADGDLDAVFGAAVEFDDGTAPRDVRIEVEPRTVGAHNTGLLRWSGLEALGPFDDRRVGEGIEWGIRLLESGLRFVMIDDLVLHRRIHDANGGVLQPREGRAARLELVRASLARRRGQQ